MNAVASTELLHRVQPDASFGDEFVVRRKSSDGGVCQGMKSQGVGRIRFVENEIPYGCAAGIKRAPVGENQSAGLGGAHSSIVGDGEEFRGAEKMAGAIISESS